MDRYWPAWMAATFVTFIVPEGAALASRRPQDTLSWWFWKHFQVITHQPISQWSATHFLFAGVLLTFGVWLLGHLILRIWT